jgi:hypothetical protein
VVLISDCHGGDEGPRLRDPALGLSAFRSRLYGCFGRRADALFELTDAILTTNANPSLVHLSLASVHRRGGPHPDRESAPRRGLRQAVPRGSV